ncbi:MAG: hypothetical protein KME30_11155 [Iphinoe sp. HA4291-MV1]|jgi:hypothetical protein|nr:hypothetical protein [Iphinoe sp. HA4291-MV1]
MRLPCLIEEDDQLEIDEEGVTNVSIISFHEVCQKLQENINHWLKSYEFFNIDRQLRSLIRQWESSGRDEGALLRGKPLSDAEYWQSKRIDELSAGEKGVAEFSS